jgi:hypothetical protein
MVMQFRQQTVLDQPAFTVGRIWLANGAFQLTECFNRQALCGRDEKTVSKAAQTN